MNVSAPHLMGNGETGSGVTGSGTNFSTVTFAMPLLMMPKAWAAPHDRSMIRPRQ